MAGKMAWWFKALTALVAYMNTVHRPAISVAGDPAPSSDPMIHGNTCRHTHQHIKIINKSLKTALYELDINLQFSHTSLNVLIISSGCIPKSNYQNNIKLQHCTKSGSSRSYCLIHLQDETLS